MDGRSGTRREFLRNGATLGAGLALSASPSVAWARRASPARPTVAVFGGGIAGLTAAHELAERGFDVTVYERRAWGGKARSTEVPGTAAGGRRALPGEHGFRVFFGFYDTLPDTMARIPFGSSPDGVLGNLVPAPQFSFSRAGQRDLVLPLGRLDPRPYRPEQMFELLVALALEADLPPAAAEHFARKLVVFMSSCDERREQEWSNISWTDFIGADRYSDDYRDTLALVWTKFLQASRAERTSAEFVGTVLEQGIYSLIGRTGGGAAAQVLDRPTNEAFIDPWLRHLRQLGVRLHNGRELIRFVVRDGRVAGAVVRGRRGRVIVRADWYLSALPVERAQRLWSPRLLAADPGLARAERLETAWMNGIKFFLRERAPGVAGHVVYLDSPWAVSSIRQAQFWSPDFRATYGDGQTEDCMSAVVSDWTQPGRLYGKPARECTPAEIAHEVWEEIKRHLNDTGGSRLDDGALVSWDLDPGFVERRGRLVSEDPLVLPTVGSRAFRPGVTTRIPNLLLCGDYLDGEAEVANMEAANSAGRRAVNAILDASGSSAERAKVFVRYRPPEWTALKRVDAERHAQGSPHLLEAGRGGDGLRSVLARQPSAR